MEKLKWIASNGGPLILLTDDVLDVWSGIYNREKYKKGLLEDADDFMSAEEADYGVACSVNSLLEIVTIGDESGLVMGDEPNQTAVFYTTAFEMGFVRWNFGEEWSEAILMATDRALINSWEYLFNIQINADIQYLFDSAKDGRSIRTGQDDSDVIKIQLPKGNYKVFTTNFTPDESTDFCLHKLVMQN